MFPILLALWSALPCRAPQPRPEPHLPWLPKLSVVAQDDQFSLFLRWNWPIARHVSSTLGKPSQPRAQPAEIRAHIPPELDRWLALQEISTMEHVQQCR